MESIRHLNTTYGALIARHFRRTHHRPPYESTQSPINRATATSNFFRIRNATAGTDWTNSVELARKDEFEASIYFHNNSSEESATYAYAQVEVPAIVPVDEDDTNNFALAYVRSSNAQPSEVMDSVRFVNNTDGDFALRYVPGSARVVSDSGVDGTKLSLDSLFRMDGPRAGGVRLGADALDGVLPPGTSGRVVFRLVAQQPDFHFENRVRIAGTKEWKRDLTVQPGARVEVQLAYANTGDTEQRNVVLKADWPKGLDYIDGRTELVNSNSGPEGLAVEDGIAAGGIDIGHYAAGANAYLYAEGIVSAPACSTVGLLAAVETNNGYLKEQSLIRVAGDDCP